MAKNMNKAIGLKRRAELAIKDGLLEKAKELIESLETTVLVATSTEEADIISDFVDDLWKALEDA